MTRSLLALLSLAVVAGCAGPLGLSPAAEESAYVGLRRPPNPPGVEDLGGYVIAPTESMDYTVGHLRDRKGEMLWLEHITHRDAEGRPFYHVLAVQRLPAMRSDERLAMGVCHLEGEEETGGRISAVIAAGESPDRPLVRAAWRPRSDERRFEAVPVERVRCVQDSMEG